MRKPQRGTVNRAQRSYVASVSSPVGGLNARDPISNMPPTDAVALDNIFCTPYDVVARNGYTINSNGYASPVNTLASYASTDTSKDRLFAWSGDKIYISDAIAPVPGPVVTGNLESKWQTVNFGNPAGSFLVAVSGSDLPLIYNGTVWAQAYAAAFNTAVTSLTSVGLVATCVMTVPHNLKTGLSVTLAGFTPAGYNGTYAVNVVNATTFTFVLAAPLGAVTVIGTVTPTINLAITGVAPEDLIYPTVFKNRLFFVQKHSTKAWYLPVQSLGGAAQVVDLSSMFTKGGYLVAAENWSLDAGYGMDDYLVFMSSNGQVVVYKGTDPASAATWSMIGVFDIGSPVGQRCFVKYAGDLLVISKDGVVPLSQSLMSTRVNAQIALTDKVQYSIGKYIDNNRDVFGWQLTVFADADMLIVNVPVSGGTYIQYVMNTISKAWSTFSGWDANCWVVHQDKLYFGGNTAVCRAWNSLTDNNTAININAQQSFNYFGKYSVLKQVKMARPVISTDGAPAILFGINVDFDMSNPTGVPTFTPSTSGIWDASLWDVGLWGGDPIVKKDWQSVFGLGYAISAHLVGQVKGTQLRWASTDFMMEDGGLI